MQKKNSSDSSWFIIGVFLTFVILVGCTVSQQDMLENENADAITNEAAQVVTTQPSDTATPSPSSTALVTVATLPSATPTLTVTSTVSPLQTPTATHTVMPTLTPLPTIPPQQRGQVYTELIKSNGGCELPCWWGFEPGVTHIEYVNQLYESFATFINPKEFANGRFRLTVLFVETNIENGEQVYHTFRAQDGVFTEALVDADDPSYHIVPILQRLGQPSEIWMWTIPEPYEGILPSRFRLYFPEQGVLVLYATGGEKIDDHVNVCFDGPGGVTLLLWDPEIWDPEDTKDIYERADTGGVGLEGFPIEEVSNWDVEQFYTILTDPAHTECLETPSNLWSPP